MRQIILMSIVLSFVSISSVKAQLSKADNAIQCSAVYHIVTALLGSNKEAAESLMMVQKTFSNIYAIEYELRTKTTITMGVALKKRDKMMRKLGEIYDRNPQLVYAIEMRCDLWRKEINRHLMSKISKKSDENYRYALSSAPNIPPIPPKNHPRWASSKILIDKSFLAWGETGRITRDDFMNSLERDLKKRPID